MSDTSKESAARGDKSAAEHVAGDSGAGAQSGGGTQQAIIQRMHQARAYNASRVEELKEFDRLTKGVAAKGVRAIMGWQRANGLAGTGKVDDRTLAAARQSGADVSFTDGEAGEIEGPSKKDESFKDAGNALASQVVARGETQGQEKRSEKPGQQAEWAASTVPEGIEKSAENFDSIEEAGFKGKAGVKGVAFLAQVPHLVDLLRDHKYGEAAKLIVDAAGGWEDRAEFLRVAIEKVGIKLAPRALVWLERVARFGLVVDVLALGWEWTKLGFESIREAHERGDQDSRIGVYAFAWSDSCLNGSHSNPGSVGVELQEAKASGIADGLATRAQYPELPAMLLAQYGGDKMNARLALQDALYQSAGFKGVRQHHER